MSPWITSPLARAPAARAGLPSSPRALLDRRPVRGRSASLGIPLPMPLRSAAIETVSQGHAPKTHSRRRNHNESEKSRCLHYFLSPSAWSVRQDGAHAGRARCHQSRRGLEALEAGRHRFRGHPADVSPASRRHGAAACRRASRASIPVTSPRRGRRGRGWTRQTGWRAACVT